jgi:orotate phosphoribosyltransferase
MTVIETPAEAIESLEELRALIDFTRWVPEGDRQALLSDIADSHAVWRGHFELQSGQHSDVFMRFRSYANDWTRLFLAARLLATVRRGVQIDCVVAPDTAGQLLAGALDESLFGAESRLCLIATDDDSHHPTDQFVSRVVQPGDRVLLVNDIVTTGAAMRQMKTVVEDSGGEVSAVALFGSRLEDPRPHLSLPASVPCVWLVTLKADQWYESDCKRRCMNRPLLLARDYN